MPYRHAHWYLLALFPFAGLAFWQSYLSQLRASPAEFHIHGITATLWLILLVVQSWTMHVNQRALHRTVGTASLILFPLFLMGGAGIFFGMADRYVAGVPFHRLFAPKLAWFDFVAVAGFAYFYFEALRQRRKVHPHSGYMLATVMFLLPPIFGRLSAIPLGVAGPEDLPKLDTGFQAANVLIAAAGFYIAYRRAAEVLEERGIRIERSLVGNYITSLEMQGFSLTVLKLDDEMVELWDAPVHTAALRWGR